MPLQFFILFFYWANLSEPSNFYDVGTREFSRVTILYWESHSKEFKMGNMISASSTTFSASLHSADIKNINLYIQDYPE